MNQGDDGHGRAAEPPLTVVERIAAAIPLVCILLAIAAPIVARIGEKGLLKMQGLSVVPSFLFSIVMLHAAAVLGRRFEILWRGNYYIGLAMSAVCAGLWMVLFVMILLPKR